MIIDGYVADQIIQGQVTSQIKPIVNTDVLPSMEELLKRAEAKGFADGQNEIANKTLLEIRRESIQIGREIEREYIMEWFVSHDMSMASRGMHAYLKEIKVGDK